jgi:hypothetical protein
MLRIPKPLKSTLRALRAALAYCQQARLNRSSDSILMYEQALVFAEERREDLRTYKPVHSDLFYMSVQSKMRSSMPRGESKGSEKQTWHIVYALLPGCLQDRTAWHCPQSLG